MASLRSYLLALSSLTGVVIAGMPGVGVAGSETYQYDGLGRVAVVAQANGTVIQYSYDALGNRTAKIIALSLVANNYSLLLPHGSGATANFDIVANANNVSPSGSALSAKSVSTPASGQAAISGTKITYVANGYVKSDSFTYTISDGSGWPSVPGTVTVYIKNNAPVASAMTQPVYESSPTVTFPVASYVSDPDGDSVSVIGVGAAQHGNTGFTPTAVTYVPTAGYTGSDSFSYTISDVYGATGVGTVTLNIADGIPVANPFLATANENIPTSFSGISNATDADGQSLTVKAVGQPTPPSHGTATANGTQITYTPATNYSGPDSFSYTVSDQYGASATSTVNMTVNKAPPPVANPIPMSTSHSKALNWNPLVNSVTDSNVGATVSVTNVGSASNGLPGFTANSLTYTPSGTFIGTDSFTYYVADSWGGTNSNTVTVTVTNQAPQANPIPAPVGENTPQTFSGISNASDPDGDSLTVYAVGKAAHGTATFSGGSITYTPASNYVGTDTFSYTVSDPFNATATSNVNITVNPGALPVANAIAISTPHNKPYKWNPLTSSVTDSNNGATVSVTNATNGSSGGTTFTANSITYTPNPGFVGTDRFTYYVTDSWNGTASNIVTVNVTNQNPIVVPQSATVTMNASAGQNTVSIGLTGDSDPDGDSISISNFISPLSLGTASIPSGGQTLIYTPNVGAGGVETLKYIVVDGFGGSAQATATISIAPLVQPVTLTYIQSSTTVKAVVPLKSFDATTYPGNYGVTGVQSFTQPANGTGVVTLSGTTLTYTGHSVTGTNDFSDTFQYTATNAAGIAVTNTVTVNVSTNQGHQ